MNKEVKVDWVQEFDELDRAVEVDKIEINWLEEFDKMIEEVESSSGYPGIESELEAEDSQTVIEGVIVETVGEDKLSRGKGEWLRELLNRKVVLPVATAVGILGLIWGGSLLVEKESEVMPATMTPIVEPVGATSGAIDTEVEAEDTGEEILNLGERFLVDLAEHYGFRVEDFLAGVGDELGGTEVKIEPEEPVVANQVDLAPGQAEYTLKFGDTMLSVAEEMKKDRLVSNQVEGLARLFKNNSWFSEGVNFDKYRDYVPEIKIKLDANPGVNPADIMMGDGRTLGEWLIQVMHDVPAGLEIKI